MSQRRAALVNLYEELRNIQLLDRVHDYTNEPDPASERAHVVRQMRRKQIVDEIARLRNSRSGAPKPTPVGSVMAIVCAIGYAMLYFLLR